MAFLTSTSLIGCTSIPSFISTGSLMIFQQTAAPTSWTKQTTHNNKTLRIVSGTASSGGTSNFTTVFPSNITSLPGQSAISLQSSTLGNTTLSTTQIPSHTHQGRPPPSIPAFPPGFAHYTSTTTPTGLYWPQQGQNPPDTGPAGGGGSHTHPFTLSTPSVQLTSSIDLRVQYVDVIICSKD